MSCHEVWKTDRRLCLWIQVPSCLHRYVTCLYKAASALISPCCVTISSVFVKFFYLEWWPEKSKSIPHQVVSLSLWPALHFDKNRKAVYLPEPIEAVLWIEASGYPRAFSNFTLHLAVWFVGTVSADYRIILASGYKTLILIPDILSIIAGVDSVLSKGEG